MYIYSLSKHSVTWNSKFQVKTSLFSVYCHEGFKSKNSSTAAPSDMFLLVCLFVCVGLSSHSRIFHSYRDVTITSEELQMLTYARHSWPLTSEGSLKCRTYLDMGHPFRMVNSRIVEHLAVGLFLRLEFVAAKILTSNLPHARVTL